jgi:hypothetical protein
MTNIYFSIVQPFLENGTVILFKKTQWEYYSNVSTH